MHILPILPLKSVYSYNYNFIYIILIIFIVRNSPVKFYLSDKNYAYQLEENAKH